MNIYKQNKKILLKQLIMVICFINLLVVGFNNNVYAKDNYIESDQMVDISITTDKNSYSNNDNMSVTVSLNNYNNQFAGNITTMIIELDYDSDILKPDIESIKNIAEKSGSMAFSHIDVSEDKSITYQYIDVEEPLNKESTALFSLVFKVNSDINTFEEIQNIIKTGRIVIQDGSNAESVRYATNVQYNADKSAKEIAGDDTVGLKEYSSTGDLLSEDEQKNIQKEAIEEKQEEEKKAQKLNNKSNNNSNKGNKNEGSQDSESITDNSSLYNGKKSNILQDVMIVIVVLILVVICCLLYKKKKNSK